MSIQRIASTAWRVAAFGLLVCFMGACSSVAPQRQKIAPDPKEAHFYPLTECGIKDGKTIRMRDQPLGERDSCFSSSVERTAQYTLFFIEFDEQGRFFQRQQLDSLVAYLKRVAARKRPVTQKEPMCGTYNDGVSIVTFVHGWRHNARYDDDNVKLAREVLRTTHLGETSGAHYNPAMCAREVVGVYVGWRGASLSAADVPSGFLRSVVGTLWEVPTVWDRKNTAQNVAVGSVRELFSVLKTFQDQRNMVSQEACADVQPPNGVSKKDLADAYQCMPVRHLIVGHSYGALIVHNAVAQQLLENVVRGSLEDSLACSPGEGRTEAPALVRSYADLIVLMNPAVEGARYEPLYEATRARSVKEIGEPGAFCANQKPVMVVLTSQGDEATRFLFRGVRYLNTILENNNPYDQIKSPTERAYVTIEEGRSSIRTLGHNDRYHTHELVSWEKFVRLYADDATPAPPGTALTGAEKRAQELRREHAQQQRSVCQGPFASEAVREARCPTGAQRMRSAFDRDADNSAISSATTVAGTTGTSIAPSDNCRRAAMADVHLSEQLLRQASGSDPVAYGWSASFLGGTVITHLPGYRPNAALFPAGTPRQEIDALFEKHSPATPIWNVYVRDNTVMNDHGNINGDALIDLIKQLYRAVVIKGFDRPVLETLNRIAKAEYQQCALPATAAIR